MPRTYEGLFILNTSGKDENHKELVEKVEKDIQAAGGKISKVERMDKRPFARVAQDVESGYYVNIVFDMLPAGLDAFRAKLKLDETVFRVMFSKPGPRPSGKREGAPALA